MTSSAQRVADRYMCRLASRQMCTDMAFTTRTAALHDLTPRVLEAFAEGFLLQSGRTASFGSIMKKLGRILDFFKKIPKAWEAIKRFIGVANPMDLPGAIKEWAKKGLQALKSVFSKLTQVFPLSLYFVPVNKAPGLTDLVHRIMLKHPGINAALASVKNVGKKLDALMDRYLPTLQRPILAAIFIYVWVNVAELSWDVESILEGFLGNITISELFASLPESGLGLLLAGAGLGYWALPVTVLARILWLVGKKYIDWDASSRSLIVRWDAISGNKERPEVVPVF